jgi:tetratricopeptide (TPR) repeat protein
LADDETMLASTLGDAQAEVQANPADALAWFSLGAAFTYRGEMQDAAAAFDEARRIGLPLRALWYQFELFEAYLAVGRSQEVIDLGYATSYTAGGHEEAYYYQGLGYAQKGEPEQAAAYYRRALEYNRNFEPAEKALAELEGAL